MNNWTAEELKFRCVGEASPVENRLPIRLKRLTQNFMRMGTLSLEGTEVEAVLAILRESKVFIELTAIDLDIDSAFELAQIQRQLSQWHINWDEIWENDVSRNEISTFSEAWVNRLREMSGVFV